jgi:hypothetical protein
MASPPPLDVVVKSLHASAVHDRSALYRFMTRTRMVARVEHKNLARIVAVGRVDSRFHVATEVLDASHSRRASLERARCTSTRRAPWSTACCTGSTPCTAQGSSRLTRSPPQLVPD